MTDRIHCLNPQCRRSWAAANYNPGATIICRPCLGALPSKLENRYHLLQGRYLFWSNRMQRTGSEIEIRKIARLLGEITIHFRRNLNRISAHFRLSKS